MRYVRAYRKRKVAAKTAIREAGVYSRKGLELLLKQGIAEADCARLFGVHRSCIEKWKKDLPK